MLFHKLLKQYDKYLGYRKLLDGSVVVFRQSPFSTAKYDILTIENQYLGSYKWVMRKIALMDSRRKDFIVKNILHNKKQRQIQKDNRASREIADYILNSGFTIVN